ncbi:hypothetical protein GS495_09700 [Rhodococcus hoagii]|nr:hypothetical protein [Prescottella equi]
MSWSGFPPETKSFAVTMFDPTRPPTASVSGTGRREHPGRHDVAGRGRRRRERIRLPAGAVTLENDGGLARYLGACPPKGHGPHRYMFRGPRGGRRSPRHHRGLEAVIPRLQPVPHAIGRA